MPASNGVRQYLGTTFHSERTRSGWLAVVIGLLSAPIVVAHFVQVETFFLTSGEFRTFHLTSCLFILFLSCAETTDPRSRLKMAGYILLALVSLVPLAYILSEYTAIVRIRPFGPNANDTMIGVLLVTLTIGIVWREWGKIIPIISLIGIAYAYWGPYVPGLFFHAGISIERIVAYLSIPFFRGVLGGLTEVSATITFMFLVFAGLMKATGGLDLVMRLAFAVGRRSRAGPAQAAVVSSGFMGMISGSIMANVASTGAFTIPLMKRVGFRGSFAGAVEAVASACGQFSPPKMGTAAFLIVGLTGIAYTEVMAAAIFPALIVYLYLAFAVHLRAVKVGIKSGDELGDAVPFSDVPIQRALLLQGHMLVALGFLVYFLVRQMPPGLAAAYACVILIALEFIKQMVLHIRNPVQGFLEAASAILNGLSEGMRSGAHVAIIIAIISILVEMLVVTGFAQKLSQLLLLLSLDNLWLLLAISALTCLLFGLGLPTSAAYILVAILAAPAIANFGVPLLAAHLFVFYIAIMSALTPPVATGAMVASSIAKSDFIETSFTAVRLALPGFILPFVFVLRPEMLMLDGSFFDTLMVSTLCLVGLVYINIGLEGFLYGRLGPLIRVFCVVGGALLLINSVALNLAAGLLLAGATIFSRSRAAVAVPVAQRKGS